MENKRLAAFITLGCRVSQYETEAIRESFLNAGFADAAGAPADVVVVNTCTVTAESDRKSAQAVRRAVRENPRAAVLVVGCSAERNAAAFAAIAGVSFVSGTADKMACLHAAEEILSARDAGEKRPPVVSVKPLAGAAYEPMRITEAPRTRAYIKIADGCNCRCTYCAISAARGPVRSRPKEEILKEVQCLTENGTREVVLSGIETASYGTDLGDYRLIDLIEDVCRLPVDRIRLGSLTPEVLTPAFLERIAALPKVMPHFHLSVQSGSDSVLAGMKRRYNTAMMRRSVDLCRSLIPNVEFTCDMLLGFPGESKENFAETLVFSEYMQFLHMHIFPFSPRAGTPAAAFPDQVPAEEKRARCRTLAKRADEMTAARLGRAVSAGRPIPVLFETLENGTAFGHSPSFMEVEAPSPENLHGRILSVRPLAVKNGKILAEIIKNSDIRK